MSLYDVRVAYYKVLMQNGHNQARVSSFSHNVTTGGLTLSGALATLACEERGKRALVEKRECNASKTSEHAYEQVTRTRTKP